MKRFGVIIILLITTSLLVISFLVKQDIKGKDIDLAEQIEKEEIKMKKGIDKVQLFNPNLSKGKHYSSELTFTLLELDSTTSSSKSFKYTVKNEGANKEKLSFKTSQRYEYELSSMGQGVFQKYSDGKMFMQVLQDITLLPNDELSYTISLPLLESGKYVLTVFLATNSTNDSIKTIKFTVNE